MRTAAYPDRLLVVSGVARILDGQLVACQPADPGMTHIITQAETFASETAHPRASVVFEAHPSTGPESMAFRARTWAVAAENFTQLFLSVS